MNNQEELEEKVEWTKQAMFSIMEYSEELSQKMASLEKLLKVTVARQDGMDSLLNSIHDRLVFSPPLPHADQFLDYIQNDMDELGDQVDSLVTGLNRIRFGSESTSQTKWEKNQPPQSKNQDWNPNL